MDLFAWLQFVQTLATAYATSQGKDIRALGYLRVITTAVTSQQVTDAEIKALMDEYSAKVASGAPTTSEELAELDARIDAASAAIQGA
jgi:uncharacterized Rossmann fold enzyme